jgi:hypothetical protein
MSPRRGWGGSKGLHSSERWQRLEQERLRELEDYRQQDELREMESRAVHRYTGVGAFLTVDELREVRRAMLGPNPGVAYRLVDELAKAKGLPELPGHWGVHLETGELLES